MTWAVDFITNACADLVGLEPAVSDTVTDLLVGWRDGPPLANRCELGGTVFYEAAVADRCLLGYAIKDDPAISACDHFDERQMTPLRLLAQERPPDLPDSGGSTTRVIFFVIVLLIVLAVAGAIVYVRRRR